MAELRHPHIVQFLGLCFLEGSALPVLVMERLDSSLDELLEGAPGLPLALKRSLLADVARGLLYLHTRNPPVVHRDLSARNVLLTSSLVAKISDLGNARIVNLRPGQLARTLTHLPGTMVYMPPEAFDEWSRYGPRLDIFSFGHLTLFTLTQVRRWINCRWYMITIASSIVTIGVQLVDQRKLVYYLIRNCNTTFLYSYILEVAVIGHVVKFIVRQ